MAAAGRFTLGVTETLADRAGSHCSNPDCLALTSGPTQDEHGAINLGEAAHIYGLTSTSARHKPELAPDELSDITNGIWLCRICHKLIDNDPSRFPAELLFEWRKLHEATIRARMGRPGDSIREKLQEEKLRPFVDASYLARQIVLDQPPHWEYKLTAEILRTEFGAVHKRWQYLKRGLYTRKLVVIPLTSLLEWFIVKNEELSKIVAALVPLLNELQASFGPPGFPGDEKEILSICRLIVDVAKNLLEWEEDVHFAYVRKEYEEVVRLMQGASGRQLDEIFRLPIELSRIFNAEHPTGTHEINLVLTLPDGYAENLGAALERAAAECLPI